MINKNLTAVDGSSGARVALEWACDLAKAHHALLVLINVLLQGVSIERLHLFSEGREFSDEIREELTQFELEPTAMPNMVGVPEGEVYTF